MRLIQTKAQAVALIAALFDEKAVGCDHEGNIAGEERNAHFLGALRVLAPGLPSVYDLTRKVNHSEKNKQDQADAHGVFASVLRQWADALDGTGKPHVVDPLARCESCEGTAGYHRQPCAVFSVEIR